MNQNNDTANSKLKLSDFVISDAEASLKSEGLTAELKFSGAYEVANYLATILIPDSVVMRSYKGRRVESIYGYACDIKFDCIEYWHDVPNSSSKVILSGHPYILAEIIAGLKGSFASSEDCKKLVEKIREYKPSLLFPKDSLIDELVKNGLNAKARKFVERVTKQQGVEPELYAEEPCFADRYTQEVAKPDELHLSLAEGCRMRRIPKLVDRGFAELFYLGMQVACNER